MLEDLIFKTGAFSSLLIFSNFFHLIRFADNATSVAGISFFAGLITLAIIYSYVTLVVIPKKAEQLLEETYPDYKIA